MSLFKTRPFWSNNCEGAESFDQNLLITTRLNGESDYVITGSHAGILRIFKPSSEYGDTSDNLNYKVSDLVVEKYFNKPILQVGCGKLVSGSTRLQIALLHPRLFSVYSLSTKEGTSDHGTQTIVQLSYEHKLRRSAANFVLGSFGGAHNRDFACVQSLDGVLSFFEQESYSFACFLPDFLLPAPIAFVKKSDCIVTCSSDWNIAAFKYKFLHEAGEHMSEVDDTGRNCVSDWRYNIGEPVLDIQVVEDSQFIGVMVLAERNLYCLNENGKVRFMKKLDYLPMCFTNYILDGAIMSLVVSETSTVLIYQNSSLKWSAKLQVLPIAIRRAFLQHILGALVLLSDEGHLECCNLGTSPSLFVATPLTNQDINFDQVGLELATLNKIIKNAHSNDINMLTSTAEREINFSVTVSPHLETCPFRSSIQSSFNNQMCTVSVEIVPHVLFEEVQISVLVQRPLRVMPPVQYFSNLSEKTLVKFQVYLTDAAEVPSLHVHVVVSLISKLGIPRCVTNTAMLPLALVVENVAPQKETQHKITISLNHSCVGLSTIFPEFAGQNSFTSTSNTVGFKNVTGEGAVVTIILAKSSERYRLQSNSFISLGLILEQLIDRLEKHFSSKSDTTLSFTFALPVNEIMPYVSQHFSVRQKYNTLQNELMLLSSQLRLIQKRLIAKFKVKNPAPLSDLSLLFGDTFSHIMKTSENFEEESRNLIKTQVELSCVLHLLLNLIGLKDVSSDLFTLLESTFCTHIYDLSAQNWEDVMEASLCYLLRTVLAKSEKDTLRAAHTSFDEVKDVAKIEKHFSQVLERIPKSHLDESLFSTKEEEEPKTEEPQNLNIGSQIGQSSSRLLSARKKLLVNRSRLNTHTDVEE